MQEVIERLQSKSDVQKAFYATASAVMVVALLFGIWGYNFAHSGAINNLASGAASVAKSVDNANIGENFSNAMEQLKQIGNQATSTTEGQGAGAKHMNVFVDPASVNTGAEEQNYGANTADVLY